MAKAIVNTSLECGTLSVPIGICASVSSKADPSFDRAGPSGAPVQRKEFDSETGDEVSSDQVRKGVRTANGFVEADKAALEAMTEESKLESVEITDFIPVKAVEPLLGRITGSYFVQPQAKYGSAKPLRLLFDGMKRRKVVGVTKIVLKSRQQAAILRPDASGALVLNTMSFNAACVEPDAEVMSIQAAEVDKRMVDQATLLVEAMTAEDAAPLLALEDDLIPRKQALIEEAATGTVKARPKTKKAPATDMADKLLEQIAASTEQAKKRRKVAA